MTDIKEFFDLVYRMRQAQKEYFFSRSKEELRKAKSLEAQVDAALKEASAPPQPKTGDLFGGQ